VSSAAPAGPVLVGHLGHHVGHHVAAGQHSHQSVSTAHGEVRTLSQSKAFGATHASVAQADNSKGLAEIQPAIAANRPVPVGKAAVVPHHAIAPVHHAPAYGHHAPAYGGYGYEEPKHNCTVQDVTEIAEVCTPAFETVCENIDLAIKIIVDKEFCYDVTRTVCTETIEEIPNEVCSYDYQKKEEATTAKTVEVTFKKESKVQMVTVCAPTYADTDTEDMATTTVTRLPRPPSTTSPLSPPSMLM